MLPIDTRRKVADPNLLPTRKQRRTLQEQIMTDGHSLHLDLLVPRETVVASYAHHGSDSMRNGTSDKWVFSIHLLAMLETGLISRAQAQWLIQRKFKGYIQYLDPVQPEEMDEALDNLIERYGENLFGRNCSKKDVLASAQATVWNTRRDPHVYLKRYGHKSVREVLYGGVDCRARSIDTFTHVGHLVVLLQKHPELLRLLPKGSKLLFLNGARPKTYTKGGRLYWDVIYLSRNVNHDDGKDRYEYEGDTFPWFRIEKKTVDILYGDAFRDIFVFTF